MVRVGVEAGTQPPRLRLSTVPAVDRPDRLRAPMPVPEERAAAYRAAGFWDDRSLADGTPAAAAADPTVLAVADGRRRLTRAELHHAVAHGVALLTEAGVGTEDGAVLIVGNTIAGAVVFHAALRLGAPVVLLDRRSSLADVSAALDVLPGRTRLVVAPEAAHGHLVPAGLEVLGLEQFGAVADTDGDPGPEPDRDAPLVILLTSGTTGRPKAVVHSINTLTAGAANMARITGCGSDDVLLLVSPLASITGVMHLILAADQHATLLLEDEFDADLTLARMDAAGTTVLGGAPVIAERLLHAARRRGADRVSLRTLALGGAMLPRPLLELATDVFGIEIARVYGSSEAPNHTGSAPGDEREGRLADDGELLPGSEVRVGSTVHPEEGLLRGPAMFLGYLDPDDNAAAFEDGWYRTGDLVELHEDRLTVTGRLKEIVNRNGLKISPSEIDAALAGLPGAAEHACFGLPDAETGERLAVAVRPEDGATVAHDDVVRHLLERGVARRKLPEQLVVWSGPLPRTASGKVVRSGLVMEWPRQRSEVVARLRTTFESEVDSN